MQRSKWAEQFAAMFATVPLVNEFVWYSPQYLNKRVSHEVCDFVLTLRRQGIVCQMKALDDPDAHVGEKLRRWIVKKAQTDASKVSGSLSTFAREPTWCDHTRRGRIDLKSGELKPAHGIVIVECRGERVDLGDVPVDVSGVPLSYFDANDFLNVLDQLRAFPDVSSYLTARVALGDDVRRAIGGELVVLEHYVLSNGTFDGWRSYDEAVLDAERERPARDAVFRTKIRADRQEAQVIEYVCDLLATRASDFAAGLNAETQKLFDRESARARYLQMQEELADLPLACRRQLGRQLVTVQQQVAAQGGTGMSWAAAHFDVKPRFEYVVVASRGSSRQVDYDRSLSLLAGAIAYYQKREGLLILDRGTGGYEVGLLPDHEPTDEMRAAGERQFGSLRITSGRSTLLP